MATLAVHVHLPGRIVPATLSTDRAESSYGRPVLVLPGGGSYPDGPVAFGVGDVTDLGLAACLVLSRANAPETDEEAIYLLAAWHTQSNAYRERMLGLATMAETWRDAGSEPLQPADFERAARAGVVATRAARAAGLYGRAWLFPDGSGLFHADGRWETFGEDRQALSGRVVLATEEALRTADVPLGDGRTLRVGEDGLRLYFAVGTGEGRDWREDPGEGLTLPRAALRGLVDALGRLSA